MQEKLINIISKPPEKIEEVKLATSQQLKLSVSKCKTFADCKAKFRFTYIQKIPRKDQPFHIFGKFVHKVLEEFHQVYIDGSDEPYNQIMTKVYRETLKEYEGKLDQEARKEAYEIIKSYLAIINNQKATNSLPEVIAVEKNFNIEIIKDDCQIILNGGIDKVQKDKDGVLHICDYKTTKNKKYLMNDNFQLLTYAYVMYLEDPSLKKIRGSYILLRHNFEYVTKEFTIDEILKTKDKFINYADNIINEKLYRANPTPLCKFCEYAPLCPESEIFIPTVQYNGEISW